MKMFWHNKSTNPWENVLRLIDEYGLDEARKEVFENDEYADIRSDFENIVQLAERYCENAENISMELDKMRGNNVDLLLNIMKNYSFFYDQPDPYDKIIKEFVKPQIGYSDADEKMAVFWKTMDFICPDRNEVFRTKYMEFVSNIDSISDIVMRLIETGYRIRDVVGKLQRRRVPNDVITAAMAREDVMRKIVETMCTNGMSVDEIKEELSYSGIANSTLVDSIINDLCTHGIEQKMIEEYFDRVGSKTAVLYDDIEELANKYGVSPSDVARIIIESGRFWDMVEESVINAWVVGAKLAVIKNAMKVAETAGVDWRPEIYSIVSRDLSEGAAKFIVGEIECPGEEILRTYNEINEIYNGNQTLDEIGYLLEEKLGELKAQIEEYNSQFYRVIGVILNYPTFPVNYNKSCTREVYELVKRYNSNPDEVLGIRNLDEMKNNFELLRSKIHDVAGMFENVVCNAYDENDFWSRFERFLDGASTIAIGVNSADKTFGIVRNADVMHLKKLFMDKIKEIIDSGCPEEKFDIRRDVIEEKIMSVPTIRDVFD